MLFNSYDFLFIFLPTTLLCYYLGPTSWRNCILALAGYLFYGYWSIPFCGLLLAVSILGYAVSRAIHAEHDDTKRRQLLALAVISNLGILLYFKYANFLLHSLAPLLPDARLSELKIMLPIGISFYVFHGISYVVDVYRREQEPAPSFIDYCCYFVMFPHLIAGPIIRYQQISSQIQGRQHTRAMFTAGVERFIVGLSKKALLADTAAAISAPLLAAASQEMACAWLGIIAFSLQIYFDFAGYSDMAIGLGQMFGFTFPENFNFPYQAQGIADFWRRWHMTLSSWLRDYVYIPLGGSRCPWARLAINVLFTMLLCGLWHGAAWTYVAWGLYFGILLVLERPFRAWLQRANRLLVIPCTYIVVAMGWVFFKADSLAQAGTWLASMTNPARFDPSRLRCLSVVEVLFLATTLLLCWLWPQTTKRSPRLSPLGTAVNIIMLLACTVVILGKHVSPFLYYQF